MKLGMACAWSNPPEKTWSYVPWNLKSSISKIIEITDVGNHIPRLYMQIFKALNYRNVNGKPAYVWKHSGINDFYNKVSIEKEIKKKDVDTILQIGDLANFSRPYYLYQDVTYSQLKKYYDLGSVNLGHAGLDIKTINRRIERYKSISQDSKGIFTMSKWFADHLINEHNIPNDKVHVVHAGINFKSNIDNNIQNNYGKRKNLIFLGIDFYRKGGDLVVKAVQKLRKEVDPEIILTIIGPYKWPLNYDIPKGVNFLGQVSSEVLQEVFSQQGILVLPTRFEAFGVAFVEALGNGIPCIGRNAFAMPEFIKPGYNGQLISRDDINELADSILSTINNEDIFKNTWADKENIRNYFSWDRVAKDMVDVISNNRT